MVTAPVWLPFVASAALGTVLGLAWNMINTTTLGRADFPNPYLHLTVTPQAHIASRPVGSSGRGARGSPGGGGGGGGGSVHSSSGIHGGGGGGGRPV